MKIIEALKTLKLNEKKIADYAERIRATAAKLSNQTSPYPEPKAQVKAWEQSILDLLRNNEELQLRLHKTNTTTSVTVELEGRPVTKTIDQWLYRIASGIKLERLAYDAMTNRGLKEQAEKQPDGTLFVVTIEYAYDAVHKDKRLMALTEELADIHMALEIANATCDVCE